MTWLEDEFREPCEFCKKPGEVGSIETVYSDEVRDNRETVKGTSYDPPPFRRVAVDDAIKDWHESGEDVTMPLHEWLGWSREEYAAWVEDPRMIPNRPVRVR